MPVTYEIRDRVAYLTLDRPDAMNAFDEPTLAELSQRVAEVAADETLKCLVITGAGETFCVGLDIGLLGKAFGDTEYFHDVLRRFKRLLLDIEDLPVPVVAAVNGLARAGGFELMLACDIVVIADEARVADHHLSFGIVPGGGATQRLQRKIGQQRAREIIFSARWVSGAEAARIGLALRSVPRSDLLVSAEEFADSVRGLSRPCLAATKAAMNEGADLPLDQALDVEIEHFMRFLNEVPNSREGYLAFVEQRNPSWP